LLTKPSISLVNLLIPFSSFSSFISFSSFVSLV